MQGLDFTVVPEYADIIAIGVVWTVLLTVLSAALSFFGGIGLALARLYGLLPLRWAVRVFTWAFMGTPLLLQLFLIYFGLNQVGIDIPAFWSGVIGLGLHFAVYNADVIRAGIVAVDRGQYEAARSLGLGGGQAMTRIVIPQAVRSVTPPLGNNLIALLKESALVSVIGVTELVHASQLAISETFRPFEFYITAAALYYVINYALELVLGRIEKRVALSR
ncbi:MAG: amino acid ABC transporter permease [Alphaproteobacteria bacterium]|uniref:Amino acid ABC transporter permease n=1 Tax=Futiania mangrovi TaxID=2959716 RepID=A0A9J6PF24_9PROT|nr:amino acid ABC transporter permease [Futiania mangrovii]MCP1337054.1 amino acid ABC transporter permease [Futiania mangrovii]MDX5362233.1 amino acid ABC transporter permease [Alphaproteobacteria bacterium]MDX5370474.1 amino acid ABC transporter permease [Alphaproteobacteria bacterium]MDX5464980.1 amino acid ABC transporter permease [Alphaproteobacteria bacterium]